jgi:hypothetical protein
VGCPSGGVTTSAVVEHGGRFVNGRTLEVAFPLIH